MFFEKKTEPYGSVKKASAIATKTKHWLYFRVTKLILLIRKRQKARYSRHQEDKQRRFQIKLILITTKSLIDEKRNNMHHIQHLANSHI